MENWLDQLGWPSLWMAQSGIRIYSRWLKKLKEDQEWKGFQNMAEEANKREEEEEAKSKEKHGLISSIQANVHVLISVLFPRLCLLMWGNPDSRIKEIFARRMQNPCSYCLWNPEAKTVLDSLTWIGFDRFCPQILHNMLLATLVYF